MNRAEKRRRQKLAIKELKANAQGNAAVDQAFHLAKQHFNSGNIKEAEATCKQVLKAQRDHPQALLMLGMAALHSGHAERASTLLRKSLAVQPDVAEAHNNLGNALTLLNNFTDAITHYQKALALDPSLASAHYNLGNALAALGQLDQAIESYQRALSAQPNDFAAHNNLGNALSSLGRYSEAVVSYQRGLAINPDYAEAHNNLGNALHALGQLDQATESFHNVLQLRSDDAVAHNNLGNVSQEQGRLREAVAHFQTALEISPGYAEAHCNLGNALRELEHLDEAAESYRQALAIDPAYAEAYGNLGNVYRDQGRFDEAEEQYRKALDINPRDAECHRMLSDVKTFTSNDGRLDRLHELLGAETTTEDDSKKLCFALAKAYDDLGDHERSFEFLSKANALRRKELSYDTNQDRQLFQKIKNFMPYEEMVEKSAPSGEVSTIKPIFILGMPRSGTTLVEHILASHSHVYGAGELNILNQYMLPKLEEGVHKEATAAETKTGLRTTYLDALSDLSVSETTITDKMPYNFRWIGMILTAIPEAKIIHVVRDPVATCWSNYKQYFISSGNDHTYDMNELAAYYQLYADLMKFWKTRFPDKIYDLDYDTLTTHQEEETRKLLTHCGLDWEDQCLHFHKTKRVVKTASSAQVRQKMYTGSSQAWEKYKNHLAPLIQGLS